MCFCAYVSPVRPSLMDWLRCLSAFYINTVWLNEAKLQLGTTKHKTATNRNTVQSANDKRYGKGEMEKSMELVENTANAS